MKLYYHPFSSYSQKALIGLYEKGVAFERAEVAGPGSAHQVALEALWPLGKFPVLQDGELMLPEATAILEYLDGIAPEPRLIPSDRAVAVQARLWDRVFDNYVMDPMQRIVADRLRPEDQRDAFGVGQYHAALRKVYPVLEKCLTGRTWAVGDAFGLVECAAAPSLFYAECVEPFRAGFPALKAYFERLLAWPSVARAVDEARFFRPYFPGVIAEGI